MISRQIFSVRPYILNQLSGFRHVHLSKQVYQSNNRPFTLSKRNRKDKIDTGALFLLVCFRKYSNDSSFRRVYISIHLANSTEHTCTGCLASQSTEMENRFD